jgi:hypothetical protein
VTVAGIVGRSESRRSAARSIPSTVAVCSANHLVWRAAPQPTSRTRALSRPEEASLVPVGQGFVREFGGERMPGRGLQPAPVVGGGRVRTVAAIARTHHLIEDFEQLVNGENVSCCRR